MTNTHTHTHTVTDFFELSKERTMTHKHNLFLHQHLSSYEPDGKVKLFSNDDLCIALFSKLRDQRLRVKWQADLDCAEQWSKKAMILHRQ